MKSIQLCLLLFAWRGYDASRVFNVSENIQEAVWHNGRSMEQAGQENYLQILALPLTAV